MFLIDHGLLTSAIRCGEYQKYIAASVEGSAGPGFHGRKRLSGITLDFGDHRYRITDRKSAAQSRGNQQVTLLDVSSGRNMVDFHGTQYPGPLGNDTHSVSIYLHRHRMRTICYLQDPAAGFSHFYYLPKQALREVAEGLAPKGEAAMLVTVEVDDPGHVEEVESLLERLGGEEIGSC